MFRSTHNKQRKKKWVLILFTRLFLGIRTTDRYLSEPIQYIGFLVLTASSIKLNVYYSGSFFSKSFKLKISSANSYK